MLARLFLGDTVLSDQLARLIIEELGVFKKKVAGCQVLTAFSIIQSDFFSVLVWGFKNNVYLCSKYCTK